MAKTISTTLTTKLRLTASYDPLSITSAGAVVVANGSAIYGDSSQSWQIGNAGLVEALEQFAVQLRSASLVTNTGTIAGHYGVGLQAGGVVVNTGTIIGGGGPFGYGVYVAGGRGTVTNAGTVIGGPGGAVSFRGSYADRLIIDPGAVFQGLVKGGSGSNTLELAAGTAGATGTLSGLGTQFTGFGTVTIDSGAIWQFDGTDTIGSGVLLTDAGTLGNAGQIDATVIVAGGGSLGNTGAINVGGARYGVTLVDGGVVSNAGIGALIAGTRYGIRADGAAATVTNSGSIIGSSTRSGGIGLYAGGTVTNAGVILGPYFYGVYVAGSLGAVANTGTIAGHYGVGLQAGGVVVNTGTIIGGGGPFGYGVYVAGGRGTVTNAGTVIGGPGGAVSFRGSYADRLIIDPGAVFQGLVKGGSGSNTLELAAGTAGATGTLSGLGTQFTGFGTVTIDSGAIWQFDSTDTIGSGVLLTDAGTLGNAGQIDATVTVAGGGSLGNTGAINVGGARYGVTLVDGGVVSNAGIGALIAGTRYGIRADGAAATVTNSGSIIGSSTRSGGIGLYAGGTVTNAGVILGPYFYGVYVGGGLGAVANTGTIAGYYGVGLQAGGVVVNTGTIIGGGGPFSYGVYVAGGRGTVTNAGTVIGGPGGAVSFRGSYADRLIIDPGAVFQGLVKGGSGSNTLELAAGTAGATGTLSGLGTQFTGFGTVTIDSGAIWQFDSTDTIGSGVLLTDAGTLGNAGQIDATVTVAGGGSLGNTGAINVGGARYGVTLVDGGVVSNAGIGALIAGTRYGIRADGAAATVTNSGSIIGSSTRSGGIGLYAGGTVTNAGVILGPYFYGVYVGGGLGAVANTGTIAGYYGVGLQAGGVVVNTGTIIGGGGPFGYGVYVAGGRGTVTNAGTVIGGPGGAVSFRGSYADRLIIDPGAVFQGLVKGGSGSNTLELAAGTNRAAGTLSGLGTQFTGFGQIGADAKASWTLTGRNTLSSGVTLTNAGTLTLSDATLTSGMLVNNGAIILDPSDLVVGGLYGAGTVTIAAGSTLEVQGTAASRETIVFGGAGAYLHIDSPSRFAGSINNFGAGDRIDLDLAGITPATASYSSHALHFGASGRISVLLARPAPVTVSTSPDGDLFSVMCFCANTLILTPAGERPVQDLSVGDLVVTYGGGVRPITWVGTGTVLATRGRRGAATPVIVRKGALGDNVPVRDLRVTKGHGLYLDGVLIPVEFLVNHRSILWDDRAQQVSLYHIELDAHDVLVADGAPAESYRDDGNRWLFDNASSGWGLPPQVPCAPVLTGGAVVDAVWRWLADRAGPRVAVPLTGDPDLHLLVDGVRLDVAWRIGAAHAFTLEEPPGSVRIASRAVEPQVLGSARDPRRLGVALRRVEVQQGARLQITEADDPRLTDGFHAFEPDNRFRWTDGEADLPAALLDGWSGPLEIVLTVGATTQYCE